ncbi:MAG: hypothetical protein V1743_04740 [Nanoarchaeota archaeon]
METRKQKTLTERLFSHRVIHSLVGISTVLTLAACTGIGNSEKIQEAYQQGRVDGRVAERMEQQFDVLYREFNDQYGGDFPITSKNRYAELRAAYFNGVIAETPDSAYSMELSHLALQGKVAKAKAEFSARYVEGIETTVK